MLDPPNHSLVFLVGREVLKIDLTQELFFFLELAIFVIHLQPIENPFEEEKGGALSGQEMIDKVFLRNVLGNPNDKDLP